LTLGLGVNDGDKVSSIRMLHQVLEGHIHFISSVLENSNSLVQQNCRVCVIFLFYIYIYIYIYIMDVYIYRLTQPLRNNRLLEHLKGQTQCSLARLALFPSRVRFFVCMPVISVVFYLLIGLAGYSVSREISRGARKLVRTPTLIKK